MRALISQQFRSLPVWQSVAIWVAVFVSPTAYFLLLMFADRMHMPAPPAGLVVALFCLIPVAALLVCGSLAWLSQLNRRWRVGWLIVTVLAMSLQFGVLLLIVIAAVTVAISPAQ